MSFRDRLKQQPLVGLAVAIAVGYVSARVVIRALGLVYERYFEASFYEDPLEFISVILLIAVTLWLIFHIRRRLWSFATRHGYKIATVAMLTIVAGVVLVYRVHVQEQKRTIRLQIARRAYSEEYERRYAVFEQAHVGATSGEFLLYERHPDAHMLYGYAKILQNMKDNGELRPAPKDPLVRSIFLKKHVPMPNSKEEWEQKQHEEAITRLAKETGVSIETLIYNFDALCNRAGDCSITKITIPSSSEYEEEYIARLGVTPTLSPELEKQLYDQIVVEKLRHPVIFDMTKRGIYLDDSGMAIHQ